MSNLFSTPKVETPPPPPTVEDVEEKGRRASDEERRRRRVRGGRGAQGTILGGGIGGVGTGKTLLGS